MLIFFLLLLVASKSTQEYLTVVHARSPELICEILLNHATQLLNVHVVSPCLHLTKIMEGRNNKFYKHQLLTLKCQNKGDPPALNKTLKGKEDYFSENHFWSLATGVVSNVLHLDSCYKDISSEC